MNIVVCVKYVPDAQSERTFRDSDKTVDREGVDGLLSELDEYAVEEALKIVEASGADGDQVTVVTVGPEQAAEAIKKSLQMGAHATKFGMDFNIDRIFNFFPGLSGGQYVFNSFDDRYLLSTSIF